jgi:hypothetical protein
MMSTPLDMQSILARVFDDGQNHSLPMRLRELAARYRASPIGEVVEMHSLVGLCETFGLHGMLAKLASFRAAPSEEGLVDLCSLLEVKRQRLASGVPVSAGECRVPVSGACCSPEDGAFIADARFATDDRLVVSRPLFSDAGRGPVVGCVSPFFCDRMVSSSKTSGADSADTDDDALLCVGLDDDRFMRRGHAMVFSRLGATSSRVFGETREEQVGFVDVALGLRGLDLELKETDGCAVRAADVVLVDQFIDLCGDPHLLGTDVVSELRRRGFCGVVVIVSGASKATMSEVRKSCPGADFVVGKSEVLVSRGLVSKVRSALDAKKQRG